MASQPLNVKVYILKTLNSTHDPVRITALKGYELILSWWFSSARCPVASVLFFWGHIGRTDATVQQSNTVVGSILLSARSTCPHTQALTQEFIQTIYSWTLTALTDREQLARSRLDTTFVLTRRLRGYVMFVCGQPCNGACSEPVSWLWMSHCL